MAKEIRSVCILFCKQSVLFRMHWGQSLLRGCLVARFVIARAVCYNVVSMQVVAIKCPHYRQNLYSLDKGKSTHSIPEVAFK